MAEPSSHFEIPQSQVRSAAIPVKGMSKPFTRPNYSAHGDFLRERAAAITAHAAAAADSEAAESLFLQLKTPKPLPVRGERERLRSAGFEIVQLSPVDPNSATVQLRKSDLPELNRKIDRYTTSEEHTGRSYMTIIEDLAPVPADDKVSPEISRAADEPVDCLLLLYSTLNDKERAAILFAMRSFLLQAGGELGEMRRFSNGVTAVEARIRPTAARLAGAAFTTLRQVVPNHVFFVPDQWRISSISPAITVEPPRLRTAVAVIDTGVSPVCRGLAGCVTQVLPYLPAGAVEPRYVHGTFVGSRIAYGDGLEEALRSGTLSPLCPIVDVPVFGVNAGKKLIPIHEGHLAAAIDDVLPKLPPNARVVNMSFGNTKPAVDGVLSLLAPLVDKHVRELNLVVVTTAGNVRDEGLLQGFPQSLEHADCRIDSPGDALLALTVGSYARFTDTNAISAAGELSAFSRRGPGPLGGLKPDLVAHGGNLYRDTNTSMRIGVHGLMHDANSWACDYGTSFAAPLVSSMSAQLMDHYQNPHANLVRALLLHFTSHVKHPSIAVEPQHLIGLGEPDLDSAMWAKEPSATFLHVGSLSPGHFTYLPFFVPQCLSPCKGRYLRIKVTVALDPPVTPDNPLEYSHSRVTLALRKPEEVGHAEVAVADASVEVDKWSPIEKLDKRFHRSFATGGWELRLRLWTRELPPEFRQGFAAVIEVIDDTGERPVFRETEAAVGQTFRHVAVRVAA